MRSAPCILGGLLACLCTSAVAEPYIGFRVFRSEQEINTWGRTGDSHTVQDTYWRFNAYAGYSFKYLALEVGGGPLGRNWTDETSNTFSIQQNVETWHRYAGLLPKVRVWKDVEAFAILAMSRVHMKNREYGTNENGPNQENVTYATDTCPMLGLGIAYAVKKVTFRLEWFRINNVAKEFHTNSSDVIVYSLGMQYGF